MELRDLDGDLFAKIAKANNGYPVELNVIPQKAGFAAWMTEGEDPTHEGLVEHLGKVAMVATAKVPTYFKTVVTLTQMVW